MNWQEVLATALIALNIIGFGHSSGYKVRLKQLASRLKLQGVPNLAPSIS